MKTSKFVKTFLAAGFVMGIYFGQPLSAHAAETRTSNGEFPYQLSLQTSRSTSSTPDDVIVDGRIITGENYFGP